MAEVELFPGTRLTPEVLLHQTMEDLSDCQAMVIIKMRKDDTVDVSMSCLSMANLAFMTLMLQLHTVKTVQSDPPEGARIFAPDGA